MPHKQFRRLTPKLRKRAIYGRKLTHFVDRSTAHGFKVVLLGWVPYFMVTLKTSSMVVTPFSSF